MHKMRDVVLSLFLIVIPLFCQVGYDRIFVVDVSGSMLQNDLYKRVQKTLIDYIKGCRPGDRIILMTFGTDINPGLDDRILYEPTISRDIEAIASCVSKLNFRDDWTWMTKAFDVIGSRLRDLQKAYPDRPKRVYVFTDGLNDPPPGKEDFLTFEDVLKTHYLNFIREGTFIYLILLDTTLIKKMDEPTRKFADTLRVKPVSRERSESILYQEIALSPPAIEKSLPFGKTVTIDWELEITRMMNVSETMVYFSLKETPDGIKAVLSPETIKCSAVGQKIPMKLQLTNITAPKTYRIVYSLTPILSERSAIVIDPQYFVVTLNLSEIIVEVKPKILDISANINKNKTKFSLTFNNNKSSKDIKAVIAIQSKEQTKTLKIEPSRFAIPQGENKIDFHLGYSGFIKGKYKYNINLESLEPNVKLEPGQVVMQLKFFEPISPLLIVLLVILILIIAFAIFSLIRIHNIFGKWTISTRNCKPESLNKFKSFISTKVIVGKDVFSELFSKNLFEIFAKFDTPLTGNLYLKLLTEELQTEKLKFPEIQQLEDINITYRGSEINIKKEV